MVSQGRQGLSVDLNLLEAAGRNHNQLALELVFEKVWRFGGRCF